MGSWDLKVLQWHIFSTSFLSQIWCQISVRIFWVLPSTRNPQCVKIWGDSMPFFPPCSDSPGRCCQWGCKTLCWRRVRSCWKPFGMQILRFSTWPWSREEACPYSPQTRDSQTLLSRNFNLGILSNVKSWILNLPIFSNSCKLIVFEISSLFSYLVWSQWKRINKKIDRFRIQDWLLTCGEQ